MSFRGSRQHAVSIWLFTELYLLLSQCWDAQCENIKPSIACSGSRMRLTNKSYGYIQIIVSPKQAPNLIAKTELFT